MEPNIFKYLYIMIKTSLLNSFTDKVFCHYTTENPLSIGEKYYYKDDLYFIPIVKMRGRCFKKISEKEFCKYLIRLENDSNR